MTSISPDPRVQKLLRLAESTNSPAEAEAARAKANRLMAEARPRTKPKIEKLGKPIGITKVVKQDYVPSFEWPPKG